MLRALVVRQMGSQEGSEDPEMEMETDQPLFLCNRPLHPRSPGTFQGEAPGHPASLNDGLGTLSLLVRYKEKVLEGSGSDFSIFPERKVRHSFLCPVGKRKCRASTATGSEPSSQGNCFGMTVAKTRPPSTVQDAREGPGDKALPPQTSCPVSWYVTSRELGWASCHIQLHAGTQLWGPLPTPPLLQAPNAELNTGVPEWTEEGVSPSPATGELCGLGQAPCPFRALVFFPLPWEWSYFLPCRATDAGFSG